MRLFFLVLSSILLLLTIGCGYNSVRLDDYDVQGIDISHYQRDINFETVKAQGYQFVFLKATEGSKHVDTTFNKRWRQLRQLGLRRGAYHFFSTQSPAARQAQNFISQVRFEAGDLPPVLDFEVTGLLSQQEIISELRTWINIVELSCNVKPIIYTNFKLYNKYIIGNFDEYPIWIAQYNQKEPKLGLGKDWTFWQYANKGLVNGLEGFIDLNVFKGSQSAFDSMYLRPISPVLPSSLRTTERNAPAAR